MGQLGTMMLESYVTVASTTVQSASPDHCPHCHTRQSCVLPTLSHSASGPTQLSPDSVRPQWQEYSPAYQSVLYCRVGGVSVGKGFLPPSVDNQFCSEPSPVLV